MVAIEQPPGTTGPLLVVDDDEDVRRVIVSLLEYEGFTAAEAATGREVEDAVANGSADLILLDIMLEREDGFEILTTIRRTSDVPVIMLTAKTSEIDRVLGLRMGADDYVTKPFSGPELVARVVSVLRRYPQRRNHPSTMQFGELSIDTASRQVWVGGKLLKTTTKEFDLLAFLAASPNQVFDRSQLLAEVWESSSTWQDDRTVTEHIRRLRCKLEGQGRKSRWIQTLRGAGYRFDP